MTTTKTINVTNNAEKYIHNIIAREETAKVIRINLRGGGCSGMQWDFCLEDLQNNPNTEDTIIQDSQKKPLIIVKTKALEYIGGSILDHHKSLMEEKLTLLDIPGETARCGCGASFAIKNK